MHVVALAGGVGAARLLRGLVEVVDPHSVTVIVNTGDDFVLHGLDVFPDLDTVTYTLADAVNPETGWGLAGESWLAMDALARYGPELGWFRLGDRDLATHLYRTGRLRAGATRSQVTAEIAAAWGVGARLLPMSDSPVATRVRLAEPGPSANTTGTAIASYGEIGFQEYFVGLRHEVAVAGVRFAGAEIAEPAPNVLDALAGAERVLICPSNPIVSVAPILAVPGIEDAVRARRDLVVAVSPIIAGAAVKGPAARLMTELGHEASVVGVARIYAPLAAVLVVDEADADQAAAVESEGMRCVVAPTLMHGVAEAAALARVCLAIGAP